MASPYKNRFECFFGTLFHSWGGDTPQEAVWAANDLIDALNELFNFNIEDRYDVDCKTTQGRPWEDLSEEIYNLLKTKS
jgi:hypothetical protein